MKTGTLIAGAAAEDITPEGSQFLFGYPHVERMSVGVHDPLFSSALYLFDGRTPLIFVANDVVAVGNDTIRRTRERIERETGVPGMNVMISASHTHSGPMTMDLLCCEADPVVPKADQEYIRFFEEGIIAAAVAAYRHARPAEISLGIADGSCVGGNRHDPAGPTNPETPVLVVRDRESHAYLAAMMIYSMHPSVLHEDSKLVSGDFPAMARMHLQKNLLGESCPVLCQIGPSGNLSPRHITRSNTFEEAERLGGLLGSSIARAVESIVYTGDVRLDCARKLVELPARGIPTIEEARKQLQATAERLGSLRRSNADARLVRTAECDWFGGEETLTLARAHASGRLQKLIASVMPAEISLFRVGEWSFAGWPGEAFVEFALEVKAKAKNCFVIGLANGEVQGYLVTEEAVEKGWYEASNALFSSPESGNRFVQATLEMVGDLK
jgi:hypothetical protein